ncbi:MAG: hypothetical protein ABIG03_07710 [Candidatus Eisenbacteria bacterium]
MRRETGDTRRPRAARAALLLLRAAALAFLLTGGAYTQAQEGAGDGWATLSGAELAVLHHPDDARYAARVLQIYEDRADDIAASMGLATLSPIRALIASSDEEFSELCYHGVPDWGVGCALVDRGLVVLKSPRIVEYPLQMESVVEHELAHVAAGRVLRGVDVPRWFDEGVAQAVAGEWRLGQAGALAGAAKSGALPPLSALAGPFPSTRESASTAYAMSFQAVRFMMEEAGVRSPGELVSAVAAAGDFEAAVSSLTGLSEAEFDRGFADFVGRRFTWGTLLNDGRALFTLVALLFVVAIGIRMRRSRAKLREWAAEERAVSGRRGSESPKDSRWR